MNLLLPQGITSSGLRITVSDSPPGELGSPLYFQESLHLEENINYRSWVPGDEMLERWIGNYVYAAPGSSASLSVEFELTKKYDDSSGTLPALLRINMVGGFDSGSTNPDHHVEIYLNEDYVDHAWWDGKTYVTIETPILQNQLKTGTNTIEIVVPNNTGVGIDVIWIDWIELFYSSTFQAENDVLTYSFDKVGTWEYQVDGFTKPEIIIYDITEPGNVAEILPTNILAPVEPDTDYSVKFWGNVESVSSYWIMTSDEFKEVSEIEADEVSYLDATTNGADYIVISHKDFLPAVTNPLDLEDPTTLSGFWASQGLRTFSVNLQDVYDQFGFGIVSPSAIHEFLSFAYTNWESPAPSYVVLVGDGNFDPKNYLGSSNPSYLPPYLAPVDPWYGETAADNRYVTIDGEDTLPDMMLGRLAVNTLEEARAFIDKIIGYQSDSVKEEWQSQVLAVADDTDSGGNFIQYSEDLLTDLLPNGYTTTKVYYGTTHFTRDSARNAVKDAISSGKLLVNYIGHGSVENWAELMLRTIDVPDLSNGHRLPIVLAMTCDDGKFDFPGNTPALAEVITRASGNGAVASWSPTGWGIAAGHDFLNRGFFEAVFSGEVSIGQATNAGKLKLAATGANMDLIDTFLLFGDPAMMLNIPFFELQAPINLSASAISSSQIDLGWTIISNNESGFQIERSLNELDGWVLIDSVDENITTYSDLGLDPDTTYYYRVRAYRTSDDVYSEYSNVASDITNTIFQFFLPLIVH